MGKREQVLEAAFRLVTEMRLGVKGKGDKQKAYTQIYLTKEQINLTIQQLIDSSQLFEIMQKLTVPLRYCYIRKKKTEKTKNKKQDFAGPMSHPIKISLFWGEKNHSTIWESLQSYANEKSSGILSRNIHMHVALLNQMLSK